MYTNNATRKHPGLVVLMIDQSGSMENASVANGKPLAVIAADSINIVLTEMVNIATKPVGDDDEEVRDYQKVVVIGYGGEVIEENGEKKCVAQKLYEGYLSDIANKYKVEKKDTIAGPLDVRNVIKPIAGYITPMASAFELAKQQINKWKAEGRDGVEDPSPIIINIAGSAPTDAAGYPTEEALEETAEEAREIMSIAFPDGSPRVFNILISQLAGNEVCFPDNTNVLGEDSFAHFLYSISSTMTEDLIEAIYFRGLGNPSVSSRMLIVGETFDCIDDLFFLFSIRHHWHPRGNFR